MKNIQLVVIGILFFVIPSSVKCQNGFDHYGNYQDALGILMKSIDTYGGHKSISVPVSFKANGIMFNLGHYTIPYERREFGINEANFFYENEQCVFSSKEIVMYGNTYRNLTFYKSDSVIVKDYFQADKQKLGKQSRDQLINQVQKSLPSKFLKFAYEHRNTLSLCFSSDTLKVVSFNDKSGNHFKISLDSKFLLTKIDELKYSDLYGDYIVTTEFHGYHQLENLWVPSERIDKEYGQIEKRLSISDFKVYPAKNNLISELDSEFRLDTLVQHKPSGVSREKIGKNLYLLKLNTLNNKVIIAENKLHFDIYELPKGFETHQAIISELQDINPNKKLKNIFVSHHHPDHAGGLRWFNEINVITTTGNVDYFSNIFSNTHSLSNSYEYISNKPDIKYEIIPQGSHRKYSDSFNESIVYEVGDTEHTKEYLVYYFPNEKILFVGDLMSFPMNQKTPFSGQRGKSVYDLILKEKLKVDKIYTSWPLKGQKNFGLLNDLKDSLIK
ncbi:hypothetical protein SanaruYs_31100 [Chryseotalea sanaruensis]|uniref:Metallo-beta-lactamase domain-containing protein n=1 Tax=Chryseotalea sanaruensis TaxID=2482724 RepID=A0A401UD61_9BACT|nr:MBL fold metallo-hydrolase [Chryseotalea sanaruensis]GCC52871.1 hypothetical protein SanaruYs_31100 [Chryseotalea sanaruensis]